MSRALALALGLAALASASAAAAIELQATNPWIRSAASGQASTPAYMDVRSDIALRLVGASSAYAERVEIVSVTTESAERVVSSLELPAGTELRLAPGGSHLSLRGIRRGFGNGDSVPITLRFEDASRQPHTVDINAQARGMSAPRPRYSE